MKFVYCLVLSILALGCSEDETSPISFENATIQGYDLSLCGCCGGWIVSIDNDSLDYRADSIPNLDIAQFKMPLDVKIDWTLDFVCGDNNFIIVNNIEYE